MPFDEEELDPHGECAAEIAKLQQALRFIRDLSTEEYGFAKIGTGSEVALRKITQRANEALGE